MDKKRDQAMTVNFLGTECVVALHRYAGNNRICLALQDKATREPVTVATLNMPEVPLKADEVIIKDYSENKGMFQALRNAHVLEPNGRWIRAGYASTPCCRLTVDVPEHFHEGMILQQSAAERYQKRWFDRSHGMEM